MFRGIAAKAARKTPFLRQHILYVETLQKKLVEILEQKDAVACLLEEAEQQREKTKVILEGAEADRISAEIANNAALDEKDNALAAYWEAVRQREEAEAGRWEAVRVREEAEVGHWEAIRVREEAEAARWEAVQARQEAESSRWDAVRLREELSNKNSEWEKRFGDFVLLDGTPYSRYLLPLEYLPSRDFQPRWGYTKPRIALLDKLFKEYTANYHDIFALMRENVVHLQNIPMVYKEENLPEPAWTEVPFCAFDSLLLYTMVRKFKPKKFIEIGSGISTCFAYKAITDERLTTVLISIDPEPRAAINAICDHIIRDGLETCDLEVFDSLDEGDILFFDGSHRAFMNSDVTVFFIDILPRIKPGVIIHIHDISLPWDYNTSFTNWYWSEMYMLAVYLMGNAECITPIAPTALMCRDEVFNFHFDEPIADLGEFNGSWRGGGSFWFTHN